LLVENRVVRAIMDGVPLELYHVRRALALLLVLLGLVVAALTWARVVHTISNPKPVASTEHATSIVWADRVFQSRADLGRWLRSHGATYAGWLKQHPVEGAVLEHRPVSTAAPQRAAQGSSATVTTRTAAPAKHPHRTTAPRPGITAAATKPAPARAQSPGGSSFGRIFIGLLALLAAACALAASLPRAVCNRFPNLARGIAPYRPVLLAGAGALMIGIFAGAALN
jgi:hypothetical protein